MLCLSVEPAKEQMREIQLPRRPLLEPVLTVGGGEKISVSDEKFLFTSHLVYTCARSARSFNVSETALRASSGIVFPFRKTPME